MNFMVLCVGVLTLIADAVCIVRIHRWWREGQAYYRTGQSLYSMAEELMLRIEGRR